MQVLIDSLLAFAMRFEPTRGPHRRAPNHHLHDLRLNRDSANAQEDCKLHDAHFADD
jgi:hypothetical protein